MFISWCVGLDLVFAHDQFISTMFINNIIKFFFCSWNSSPHFKHWDDYIFSPLFNISNIFSKKSMVETFLEPWVGAARFFLVDALSGLSTSDFVWWSRWFTLSAPLFSSLMRTPFSATLVLFMTSNPCWIFYFSSVILRDSIFNLRAYSCCSLIWTFNI